MNSCTFRGIDCLATITSDESFFMDYEVIYFAFYCLGCNWVTSEHIYLFNPILPQLVTNPLYGNCFNIFAADESFGKSSLTGSSYGLVLELDVEQEDYLQGGQVTRSPPLTPPSKDKHTCNETSS